MSHTSANLSPRNSGPAVSQTSKMIAAATVVLLIATFTPLYAQVARLNVTGVWEGNFYGGSEFHLTQAGDRAWGTFSYGNGNGFARGSWSDGRLILILTPTTEKVGGDCDPRKILVISAKGTATFIEPYTLDLANNGAFVGRMTRKSPSAGWRMY